MEICPKKNCTGCFACMNACPMHCITMQENVIGHIFPAVDMQICISCGLCRRICPYNSAPPMRNPEAVYAAWSLNNTEHEKSTSGGIATYFSRCVIDAGGVVYGCSSSLQDGVRHIRVNCIEELDRLRGSKYVHSYIGFCYTKAETDLQAGLKVLFIGMPCQIAGLYAYLGKRYDHLVTIDIICHGVPPQKLLMDDLKSQISGESDFSISFRENEGFYINLFDTNGHSIYRCHEYKNLYYLGFQNALFFRDSCYQCSYAQPKRCADITVGDFWELGKDTPFIHPIKNGVSVVLVNTELGKDLFSAHIGGIFYEKRELTEAVKGNHNLSCPSNKNVRADEFCRLYPRLGYDTSIRKCLKKERFKYVVLGILQKSRLAMWAISKKQ